VVVRSPISSHFWFVCPWLSSAFMEGSSDQLEKHCLDLPFGVDFFRLHRSVRVSRSLGRCVEWSGIILQRSSGRPRGFCWLNCTLSLLSFDRDFIQHRSQWSVVKFSTRCVAFSNVDSKPFTKIMVPVIAIWLFKLSVQFKAWRKRKEIEEGMLHLKSTFKIVMSAFDAPFYYQGWYLERFIIFNLGVSPNRI